MVALPPVPRASSLPDLLKGKLSSLGGGRLSFIESFLIFPKILLKSGFLTGFFLGAFFLTRTGLSSLGAALGTLGGGKSFFLTWKHRL